MSSDSDELIASVAVGGLGFLVGKAQYANWDPIIKEYNTRCVSLTFTKTIKPVGVFLVDEVLRNTYSEALTSFLYGLPNASIAMSLKFLEIVLKKKYTNSDKKEAKENLQQLIDHAENVIGVKTETAHSFRMLRNLVIHGEILAKESDALEALRHISLIANSMYPYGLVNQDVVCPTCKRRVKLPLESKENYFGNVFHVQCGGCNQNFPFSI